MENRKIIEIGEILEKANTGLDAIKRAPIVEYDSGIKCLRIQDVSQSKKFEDWGFTEVSENNFGKFQLKKGDIIVARTGATIGVNRFINEDINAVFNNGLIKLKVNENKCLPKYLFYNLQSYNYWGYIDGISGGTSTQPNMQINALLKYEIQLPPLPEQKAIASVLSSLDDKIDLLHQQNQTLETLAETLFRQWFIEEAKEDWEEVPLKDLVKLLQGKYVSAEKISEAINLDQKFPLYGGNGIRGYLNTYQFKERKVAITCRGNGCGLIQLLNPFSNISNSCIVLNNDENLSIWFIYYYSKTLDFFSVTSGSAQPQITITDIGTLNITIPDIEILVKFDKIVKSYHDKIFENQQQIQTLTQLRDTLLPKLMSGEVRVQL